MIRESNFISENIVGGITYKHVTTLATDSTKPNQMEISCNRFIGDKMIRLKETRVGVETNWTRETDLDDDERHEFEEQWRTNWNHNNDGLAYVRVAKMEVNGTVLCEEMHLEFGEKDDDKAIITCKRSIGDKSITAKKRLGAEKEVENMTGAELRARFHELRDFEKEWGKLWKPDESF